MLLNSELSLGTKGIIDKLSEYSKNIEKHTFDAFYINIVTILRNNIEANLDDKKIINKTMFDLDRLLNALSAYLSLTKDNVYKYIYVYIPKYGIPKIHARKQSPSNHRLFVDLVKKIYDTQKDFETISIGDVDVFFVKTNEMKLPHLKLYDLTRQLFYQKQIVNPINRINGLISHIPMDYHLRYYLPNIKIIESYTGNIRLPHELGEKIFSSSKESPIKYIPFNRYTHLLFGDKIMIQPFAKYKDKSELNLIGEKQRWNLIPEESILRNLKATNRFPIEMLTTWKF